MEPKKNVSMTLLEARAFLAEPRTGLPVEDGPIVEIERQTPKRTGIALDLDRITSWDFTKP